MKHLDQRITLRYHLNTLDYTHTANYIAHRLKMAGQTKQLFTEEAVKLIFDFTRGTPREINNLCDVARSEEHTSELQSHSDLVCRLLLEKKKEKNTHIPDASPQVPCDERTM